MKEVSAAVPAHLMADPKDQFPKAKNTMGKDDFMKLLMAQLQNQDPLKPVDHHEFVAQLAQFGSLEQLTNIQKGIEGLQKGNGEESKVSAIGMIGKKVEAAGSQVELLEGQPVTLKYSPKADTTPVRAQIYTEGGTLVRELDLGGKVDPQGIQWDGKDQEGKSAPTGRYTFRVQGVDNQGQAQELGTELAGKVVGVEMDGQAPMLVVKTASGNTKIELGKIRNVMADDAVAPTMPGAISSPAPTGAPKPVMQVAVPREDGAGEAADSEVPAEGAIGSPADLERMFRGYNDVNSLGSR